MAGKALEPVTVHRWRAVVDFYADDTHKPAAMAAWFRAVTSHAFPLGVVEGGPDVWDLDDKIEAVRRAREAEQRDDARV